MKEKKSRKKAGSLPEAEGKIALREKKRPKTKDAQKPELDVNHEVPSRLEKPKHGWQKRLPKGTWRT